MQGSGYDVICIHMFWFAILNLEITMHYTFCTEESSIMKSLKAEIVWYLPLCDHNPTMGGSYQADFPCSIIFPVLQNCQILVIEYDFHISRVSLQLSCGDPCQIGMWFKPSNRQLRKIRNLTNGSLVLPGGPQIPDVVNVMVKGWLTHCGLVIKYSIRKFVEYWFKERFCWLMAPSHYMNQWWLIINCWLSAKKTQLHC